MNKFKIKKTLFASILAIVLANSSEVYAEEDILDQYLEEQIDYYKNNPEAMEEDAKKYEIVIDTRGDSYEKIITHCIKDYKNEYGDVALLRSTAIGNASSTGDGNKTKSFDTTGDGKGYKVVAIVGVKTGAKYPFAVCEYDVETNTLGDIIGWYKDKDVFAYCNKYAEVIEMPISKYISYGNISDFYLEKDGTMTNISYWLPIGFTPLDENHEHGIRIDYTSKDKKGYYSSNDGYYIPEKTEIRKAKLDNNNLEKTLKFNIINK